MDSDYTYSVEGETILIIDKNIGGRSVTNNISNVLKDISYKEGIDPKIYNIAYKDSMGNWDGVLLSNNGMASFYPIRKNNENDVIEYFKTRNLNSKT